MHVRLAGSEYARSKAWGYWSFARVSHITCQDFKTSRARKYETELSGTLLLSRHSRRIPFREKILWTGISLFVFLVCCQIPILGCNLLQLHTLITHFSSRLVTAYFPCLMLYHLLYAKVAVQLATQFMHRQEVRLVLILGYMGFLQTSPQSHGCIDETCCLVC